MRRSRAQSLIELALVAPVLILLAMSVWDGGGALREQVVLQQAARDGARAAATAYGGNVDATVVSNAILASASADLPGLSNQPGFFTLSYPDPQSVRVDVHYSHALMTPVLRQLWSGGNLTLQASATFYLPQLTPVPATIVIPTATPIPTSTTAPTSTPPAPTATSTSTATSTATGTPTPSPTPSADLAITKTDSETIAVPGSAVSYTIVVANNGPSAVSGAAVSDTFPAVLTGVTWTCGASSGSSCAAVSGSGSIATTVNLANGGTATFVTNATLSTTATGTLANTAIVSSSVPDPNTANNTASDTDTIAPFDATPPNLMVTATPSYARTGTLVTISVASDEQLAAAPVVTVSGGCIATATITMSPAGQSTSYTGSYTVPAGATDCTAVVSASGSDLNANQATSTATFQIDRVAPVLSISASPSPVGAGRAVSIGIGANETLGATPALSVTGSCIATSNPSASPAGQGTSYSATYTVPPGSTSCTASVTATGSDLAGNSGSASTTFVIDRVAPTLSASAAPSPAGAGAQVSITVNSDQTLAAAPSVTISGSCIPTSTLTLGPSGQATSYSGLYTVPAGSTNCTAQVAAAGTDLAGNTGTTTTAFSIDRISPALTVIAAPSVARSGSAVAISVSASETLRAAPVVTLSGACIATTTIVLAPAGQGTQYSGSYVVPAGTTDCPVIVSATGADLAGNSRTGSTSFQVERSTPVLEVTANPTLAGGGRSVTLTVTSTKTLATAPSVTLSGSCIAVATVSMSPAGQATTYTGTYVVPAGTSSCTATVTATGADLVGNSASDTTTFQIDRTPPVLTVTASVAWATSGTAETITVTSTSTLSGAPSLTLTGACIATARPTMSPNGQATTYTAVYVVPNGTTDCLVNVSGTGSDLAGNSANASTTFGIDRTRPSPPTSLKANPGTFSGSVSVTWNPGSDASAGITNYILRYAPRPSSGSCPGSTPVNFPSALSVGNVTFATVSGLVAGDFYCFYAVAVDAAGNVSDPSNVDVSRARP